MSKKKYNREPYEVLKEEVNAEPIVEESSIDVEAEEVIKGVVCDCAQLNVRKEPSLVSNIEVIIPVGSEVDIIPSFKDGEWYKICTATKVDGYVMKPYVAIKE